MNAARRRLAAAVLVSGSALGCEDARAPFDLDAVVEPSEDCVTVVHEALELGPTVHRYVADGPSSAGGWALATILYPEGPVLAMVRVPAGPDEPPTPSFLFGVPEVFAQGRFEFRVGAAPGELWLLHTINPSSATHLLKFVPKYSVVSAASLTGLVSVDGLAACPTRHHFQLLLIQGRPYVLAFPDCAEQPGLMLQLIELDPTVLVAANRWSLSFNSCAADPFPDLCAVYGPTIEAVTPGEATHFADAERVAVGFAQDLRYPGGGVRTHMSLLELRRSGDEVPKARVVTAETWTTPTILGRIELGQDPFSTALFVRNLAGYEDAALLRFDMIGEHYLQIKAPDLPLGDRGRLAQLDHHAVMLGVSEGSLLAVPLIHPQTWPSWEPRTLLELDDLVAVEPAGVGHVLLRREHAWPQVLRLSCD
jgi:hypothetical protein